MRNRGFKKKLLAQWFSQVKYSNRTKFLDGNPEDTCYYQGTRETLADTNLINIGEGIFKEALVTSTKEAAEVASEDEDTEASKEASTYQTVLSSKGSSHKRVVCSLSNAKMKKQKTSVCSTVFSSDSKSKAERMCCIFPGSVLEIQKEINEIFAEEMHTLFQSEKMRKIFKNFKICAIIKNQKSIKNLVVKTKIKVINFRVGNSYKHHALVIRTSTVCSLSFMIVDIV